MLRDASVKYHICPCSGDGVHMFVNGMSIGGINEINWYAQTLGNLSINYE